MKRMMSKLLSGLLSGLIFISPTVFAETSAKANFFDGRLLTSSELKDVQINLPGLYNPMTGQRSTQEDFEKEIVIVKAVDASSSAIADAYYTGEKLESISVKIPLKSRDGRRKENYLTFEFERITITSLSTGGSSAAAPPIETVTFNYEEIKFEYNPK